MRRQRGRLAANQVGEALHAVVEVDDNPGIPTSRASPDRRGHPVIEPVDDERVVINEGCLSVPDLRGDVERFVTVRLRYLDPTGWPTTR
jgi:peptide deformylase